MKKLEFFKEKLVKILCLAVILIMITGCGRYNIRNPLFGNYNNVTKAPTYKDIEKYFSSNLSVIEKTTNIKITLPRAVSVSKELYNRPINGFSFYGTIEDFVKTLGLMQINTVLAIDEEHKGARLLDSKIYVSNFSGKFGSLLENLSKAYGFIFEETDGTLLILPFKTFSVHVGMLPKKLADELVAHLKKVSPDITDVFYKPATGVITWRGTAKSIEVFRDTVLSVFSGFYENLAQINLEILVFDIKDADYINFLFQGKANSGSFTLSVKSPEDVSNMFTNLVLDTAHFNSIIGTMVRAEKAELIQKLYITMLNGQKGEINIGEKYPYIESITSSSQGGATSNLIQTNVNFGEVLSGIRMKLEPRVNRQMGAVIINTEIASSDVVKMLTVKAGDSEYTRPQTREKKIKTTLIVPPGKIVVFGGMAYGKRNKMSSFLLLLLPGINKTHEKGYLFFAIRPIVTYYKVTIHKG